MILNTNVCPEGPNWGHVVERVREPWGTEAWEAFFLRSVWVGGEWGQDLETKAEEAMESGELGMGV